MCAFLTETLNGDPPLCDRSAPALPAIVTAMGEQCNTARAPKHNIHLVVLLPSISMFCVRLCFIMKPINNRNSQTFSAFLAFNR